MDIFLKKNSCFSDICKRNSEICLQIDVIAIYVHAFKIVRAQVGLLYSTLTFKNAGITEAKNVGKINDMSMI